MSRPRHPRSKPSPERYTSVTRETPNLFDPEKVGGFALFRTVTGPQSEFDTMLAQIREALPGIKLEEVLRISIVRRRLYARSCARSKQLQEMTPSEVCRAVCEKYRSANVPDEAIRLQTAGRIDARPARDESTAFLLPALPTDKNTLRVVREKALATTTLCELMEIDPNGSERPHPPKTHLLIGTIPTASLLEQFSGAMDGGPTLPEVLSTIEIPQRLELGKRQFDVIMPSAT